MRIHPFLFECVPWRDRLRPVHEGSVFVTVVDDTEAIPPTDCNTVYVPAILYDAHTPVFIRVRVVEGPAPSGPRRIGFHYGGGRHGGRPSNVVCHGVRTGELFGRFLSLSASPTDGLRSQDFDRLKGATECRSRREIPVMLALYRCSKSRKQRPFRVRASVMNLRAPFRKPGINNCDPRSSGCNCCAPPHGSSSKSAANCDSRVKKHSPRTTPAYGQSPDTYCRGGRTITPGRFRSFHLYGGAPGGQ
jgi:hypothetical protein